MYSLRKQKTVCLLLHLAEVPVTHLKVTFVQPNSTREDDKNAKTVFNCALTIREIKQGDSGHGEKI